MNYLLLIYQQEQSADQPESTHELHDECVKTCEGLVDRLWANGQYVAAGILQPTSRAKSVRLREGKRTVTDGPFAETREQLAGYLLIDAPTLEDAIDIAAQHPIVNTGTVEVRPLMEVPFLAVSSQTGKL